MGKKPVAKPMLPPTATGSIALSRVDSSSQLAERPSSSAGIYPKPIAFTRLSAAVYRLLDRSTFYPRVREAQSSSSATANTSRARRATARSRVPRACQIHGARESSSASDEVHGGSKPNCIDGVLDIGLDRSACPISSPSRPHVARFEARFVAQTSDTHGQIIYPRA